MRPATFSKLYKNNNMKNHKNQVKILSRFLMLCRGVIQNCCLSEHSKIPLNPPFLKGDFSRIPRSLKGDFSRIPPFLKGVRGILPTGMNTPVVSRSHAPAWECIPYGFPRWSMGTRREVWDVHARSAGRP